MSNQDFIIPNVLADRYATKEMVAIFNPINKIIAERTFWITILKLQKKAGLPITDSDIASYEKVIDKVDLASIQKREMRFAMMLREELRSLITLQGLKRFI